MCGIIGAYATKEWGRPEKVAFEQGLKRITPRGPDESGEFHNSFIHLGHRRLSILDLSPTGKQPMISQDKQWVMIFNGEIYNYIELKNKLKSLGHEFVGTSDSEVLLHWWQEYGVEGLGQLNGYFAFAVYNSQSNQLYLIRDRLGVKPLFYSIDSKNCYFGSDVQAVRSFLSGKPMIDPLALRLYFTLSYIPSPFTYDERIKQIPPGHWGLFNGKDFQLNNYWKLEPKPSNLSYQDAKDQLHDIIQNSIDLELRSDVPVGTFLSGGIDSSLVTALAAKRLPRLKTYTIGFSENKYFDETHYAKLVADKYNTDHKVITVGNQDLLNALPRVLNGLDQPFSDSSALPTFILCENVANEIKVVLSGDGADEIFAGYNKYHGDLWSQKLGLFRLPAKFLSSFIENIPEKRNNQYWDILRKAKKLSLSSSMSVRERYRYLASYVPDQGLFSDTFLQRSDYIFEQFWTRTLADLRENEINSILATDTKLVLPDDMLVKVDRMSMSKGLEVRVPLLDHRIVEFAFSLPASYKISLKQKKIILRDIAQNYLPPELYNRPKQGFSIPITEWISGELNKQLRNSIDKIRDCDVDSIFNHKFLNTFSKQRPDQWDQRSSTLAWSCIVYSHFI